MLCRGFSGGVRHVGVLVWGQSRVASLSEGDSEHYTRKQLTSWRRRAATWKQRRVLEGREVSVVLGGDPVVTLGGAVPLRRLWQNSTPLL